MKNSSIKFRSSVSNATYSMVAFALLLVTTASSCAIRVCPTYDGATRAEFRKVYTSTTKHGTRSGYSVIKKRRSQ